MRRLHCWNDLVAYGVIPLTGESCGLGYRILFDVTERGRGIVGTYLGVPDIRLAEAWNRGDPADPHVGAVMLSREMFVPIAVFALLQGGCTQAWQLKDGSVLGIEADDSQERIDALTALYAPSRVGFYAFRGSAGDRNVHVMSGRIV
jgi:hypothetical protein